MKIDAYFLIVALLLAESRLEPGPSLLKSVTHKAVPSMINTLIKDYCSR
ncbi:hypothetical protein LINGRAHAP2_LOCUS6479, partial [Linum grandiflorum]